MKLVIFAGCAALLAASPAFAQDGPYVDHGRFGGHPGCELNCRAAERDNRDDWRGGPRDGWNDDWGRRGGYWSSGGWDYANEEWYRRNYGNYGGSWSGPGYGPYPPRQGPMVRCRIERRGSGWQMVEVEICTSVAPPPAMYGYPGPSVRGSFVIEGGVRIF